MKRLFNSIFRYALMPAMAFAVVACSEPETPITPPDDTPDDPNTPYIIENNATVRQTAKQFGVSKSTVHVVVTIWSGGKVRLFG